MSEEEITEAARHMLDNCKLSGAALELCETIVTDGPAKIDLDDSEETDLAYEQRRKVKELCILHGVAV